MTRSIRALLGVVATGMLGIWLPALPLHAEADEAVARGEGIYNSLCWTCHGRYGRGDGPAVERLAARPPDLTNSAVLGGRSDAELLARLAKPGHTPMALAAILREEALGDAIAFVRTLSVPGGHGSLRAGRDIYNASCWVCHGVNGDGKGPASHNMQPPPRDFTSPAFRIEGREEEVYEAISLGPAMAFHGAPYMPEWGTKLSPEEIRDVVEYLKTLKQPGS